MGNRFAPKARRTPWFAYIAAMWALAFALMSFYWAAGGTLGANTLATGIANLSEKRDFWFVAILWLTGALKLLGTFIAVKLPHLPFPLLPYRLSRLAAWLGGSFMILYGGANLTVRAIMAVRLLGTPDSMHSNGTCSYGTRGGFLAVFCSFPQPGLRHIGRTPTLPDQWTVGRNRCLGGPLSRASGEGESPRVH